MAYETIEVNQLTPTLGAEIQGVDLSKPLSNHQSKEIHDALLENQVILIPVFKWQEHMIVRLSVQGYNSKPQMDLLLDALTDLLGLQQPTRERQHG